VRAKEQIIQAMQDCLPEDTPLPFKAIKRARFNGSGKMQAAIGEVEMFDGLNAVIKASKWGHNGWTLCWLSLDGGAINFNGKVWERVKEGKA